MSVVEVDDDKKLDVKPNCVYVIAPNRKLEISDGKVAAANRRARAVRSANGAPHLFRKIADARRDDREVPGPGDRWLRRWRPISCAKQAWGFNSG